MKVRACDLGPLDARDGGPCPCIPAGETVARRDRRTRCSADPDFKVRCHGETKKAAQRFRDRRLNDLRSAARPTRSTGTDASVTIRPLILTPALAAAELRRMFC